DQLADIMVEANKGDFRAYLARARYRVDFDAQKPALLDKAAEDLTKARSLAPKEAEVLLVASEIALVRGKSQEARELLTQGIQDHPKNDKMCLSLVLLEAKENQPDRALAVARQGLKILPDNNDLVKALADLLVDRGELKEAEEVVARLNKLGYQP